MLYGQNTFEVLPAPGGKFRVFVNKQAVAEHACPRDAEAHCERLKQQGRQQDDELKELDALR